MIDKELKELIDSRNYTALRDALKNRLLLDHDVSDGLFNELWTECEKAGIVENLYQAHDGRVLSDEISKDNFNTLVGQLATNFSRERLSKTISLAKTLWAEEQSVKTAESAYSEKDRPSLNSGGRVVGEERIISERVLSEKQTASNSHETSSRRNDSRKENHEKDSGLGVVVAVAAAAVVAVIAGVVIFG